MKTIGDCYRSRYRTGIKTKQLHSNICNIILWISPNIYNWISFHMKGEKLERDLFFKIRLVLHRIAMYISRNKTSFILRYEYLMCL